MSVTSNNCRTTSSKVETQEIRDQIETKLQQANSENWGPPLQGLINWGIRKVLPQ